MCWPPIRRRLLADQINAWVVWMDETPLFRGRAYQFMLGTKSVVGTITDITNRLDIDTLHEIGVRELRVERDRPGGDFAVASGGLRTVHRKAATSAASFWSIA